MRYGFWLTCLLLLLNAAALRAEAPVLKSTAGDQRGVEVTVYNSNIGLVKDTRNVPLFAGVGELRFMDVAARIMPVTVHVSPAGSPQDFRILEQNYEYDLINGRKLLDKYVGKEIKIVDWNKYQDRKETVEATLLSNNEDQIYRIGGEIYIGHPGIKVLPQLPENLIAKPTLTWLIESESAKPRQIVVSYLTEQINWKADYVMLLDALDTSSELAGWVTIDNRSGATYEQAKLKLVAGEVHRVRPPQEDAMARKELMAAAAAPQFEEQPFFEYHIYDLARPTTIKNNQTKQISLFEAAGVGIEKEYRLSGSRGFFSRPYPERKQKQSVEAHILFENSTENKLGIPLPAGVVRLYKKDATGSQQFIGEDMIAHVPKDERVELKIGEAFDISAEKTQTDFQQISARLFETHWEIVLKNHKPEDIVVDVIETVHGNWNIIESSHPYEKLDAFRIRFAVPVPEDGRATLTYGVRLGI